MARPRDFDEQKVLEKAMQLFWLKGYNGTSPQDLLDALSLSRSSLYRTFTDKHTLFIKALAHYQEFSTAEIKKVIDPADTIKESIRKVLEFIADAVLSDELHKGCFMLNSEIELSLHDAQVHDMVIKNDREIENIFFELIEKGIQTGEVSKNNDPRAMAGFFLNTAKGIRVTAKSNPDKKLFQYIIDTAVSTLQ